MSQLNLRGVSEGAHPQTLLALWEFCSLRLVLWGEDCHLVLVGKLISALRKAGQYLKGSTEVSGYFTTGLHHAKTSFFPETTLTYSGNKPPDTCLHILWYTERSLLIQTHAFLSPSGTCQELSASAIPGVFVNWSM